MRRLAMFDRGWVLALLTLVACLMRTPHILPWGRLWAEEARAFATDLAGHGLVDALSYTFSGTLFVLATIPLWLGLQLPVDWLPVVTTWSALAMQALLAVFFARWARAAVLPPGVAAACWLAFLLLPVQYEIAATLTNVQWIGALSCLVLLLTPAAALPPLAATAAWVLLCGLTGAPSCMLAPAFLARGVLERSRSHLILGATLAATTLVQVWSIHQAGSAGRAYAFDPLVFLLAGLAKTVWLSVLELSVMQKLTDPVAAGGGLGVAIGAVLIVGGSIAVAVAIRLARRGGARWLPLLLILAVWIYVTALNIFGALGPTGVLIHPSTGERYFATATLCWLMLVALAARAGPRWHLAGLAFFAWVAALAWAQSFRGDWAGFYAHGPDWQQQVAACRAARTTRCLLRAWPVSAAEGDHPWGMTVPAADVR